MRDYLAEADAANLVIYSGFSPFVGAGTGIGGWSFAIDLTRAREVSRKTNSEFRLKELYDFLQTRIEALSIEEVTVRDQIYISGIALNKRQEFLQNINYHVRPKTSIEQTKVNQLLENSDPVARFHKIIQFVDRDGELIISVLLRLYKTEANLFVEVNYYILGPINRQFRKLDTLCTLIEESQAERGDDLKRHIVYQSFLKGPILWALSPILACLDIGKSGQIVRETSSLVCDLPPKDADMFWDHHWRYNALVRRSSEYDYGAGASVRELASAGFYRSGFERSDKEFCIKVIEKRILDSIVSFLEDRGIDASEIESKVSQSLTMGDHFGRGANSEQLGGR